MGGGHNTRIETAVFFLFRFLFFLNTSSSSQGGFSAYFAQCSYAPEQIPRTPYKYSFHFSHLHTHITFTRNAADHNITQSVLTRCHLSQSIVRAGKMLSITTRKRQNVFPGLGSSSPFLRSQTIAFTPPPPPPMGPWPGTASKCGINAFPARPRVCCSFGEWFDTGTHPAL